MKARAMGSHVDLFTGQKMTQVLKGRDDVNVQFFMPLAMHPLKPALEYLVFLAYRSEQDAKDLHTSLRAALSSEENDRLRCQFAQGYYAPLDVAPMPFDAEAGRQFGGDWLALASSDGVPSGILLCQVQGVDVHDRDSQSHRRKKSGGAVVSMRQWHLRRSVDTADGPGITGFPRRCPRGRWRPGFKVSLCHGKTVPGRLETCRVAPDSLATIWVDVTSAALWQA